MALFEGLRQLFGRNEELTDEQKKRRGRLNRVARGAGVVASPITAVSLIPKEKKDKALEFGKSVVQGTARNVALVASGLFGPSPEGQKPTLNPKKRFQQLAENPITVQSKAASMLFGKPQGESFSLKSEGGEFLSSFGAGENTQKKLAAPLGVFLGTLDAAGIPAGKIAKEAKVLVKLTDELEIIPKIKKMFPGASELDIEELSRRVANISDEKEIESILKNPQKVLEEVPAGDQTLDVYHGTKDNAPDISSPEFKIRDEKSAPYNSPGLSVTVDKKTAEIYGKKILDLKIDPNAKIIKLDEALKKSGLPTDASYINESEDKVIKWAKDNGYDGIDLRGAKGTFYKSQNEIRIFNKDILKTKSKAALNAPRLLDEANPTVIRESAEEGAKLADDIPTQAADDVPVKNMDEAELDVIIKEKAPINMSKFGLTYEDKLAFVKFLDGAGDTLKSGKGAPIKWDEVAEAAKDAQALTRGMSRQMQLDEAASIQATRAQLKAVLKADGTMDGDAFVYNATKVMPIVDEMSAFAGRMLNFHKMKVGDSKNIILDHLATLKDRADEIAAAAKGVDFNDANQSIKFYRKFFKPKFGEILTEYRYANMLSSPRTQIINAFTNAIQGGLLRPLTKLTTGVFDVVGSALTGKARKAYASEVPAYYKGFFNSVPDAARKFVEVMSGKIPIEQLDIKRLPTDSKFMKYTGLRYVGRLMEANDVLFRTMIEQGEKEALAYRAVRQGGKLDFRTLQKIDKEANATALESVFRKPLDTMNETGQGSVLSAIDKATALMLEARNLPGVGWFVPFIQTPMNILKQGIEYSPLGALTLINNTRKTEQLAKMAIGSAVFVGAGALALEGKTTWGAPENAKDREAFYASGRRPYSVKIGDNWVSYSKLGPLAYPMALASAVQYYWNENPDSYDEEAHNKALLVLQGITEFLTDQSYMQGLSEIMGSVTGAPGSKDFIPTVIDTFTGQLIPLSSLQRWVNNFIDPIYRKQDSDLSVEAIINNLKPNIIGLKSQMDAYTNPDGTASVRDYPGLNAFSPMEISSSKPEGEELYTEGLKMRKIANQRKISDDEVKAIVDELNSLPLSKAILEFTKLKKENPALAQRVDSQKKKEKLALTPLQERMASLNVTDGTRAEYIYSYVHSLPLAERAKVIAELRAKKIITEAVEKQLKVIASTQ